MLALRNLGLGLESIAVCLDAGVDPARLVRDHLAEVEAARVELGRRRDTLRRLVETLDAGRVPDTAALLGAVRASTPSASRTRTLLAAASAAALLSGTVAYAVLAALGEVPWAVVPALLVATAVYGLVAWYRLRRPPALTRGHRRPAVPR